MRSGNAPPSKRVSERIVSVLQDRASSARAADVRIGLGYTAVLLDDGGLGVAFTSRDQERGGCGLFQGIRPLSSRPAADLLPLLASTDPIEAAVGLACANALANRDGIGAVKGDVLERVELRRDDDVAMIGHFRPLVSAIQQRARSLVVLERSRDPSEWAQSARESRDALRRCQVALITATAIINHTIDDLLEAASGCREVVILGASTPLLPEAFGGESVTLLSGVVVEAPDALLRVISEGGGTRSFGPHVRKVSLPAMRVSARQQDP
jgi:uncharacterized protein (DUF4213/DUF364 family)